MVKLIRADISRMWKTRSFWVCGIIAVGLTLFVFLMDHAQMRESAEHLGSYVYRSVMLVMCCVPIFAVLFIGTDYSGGTVRNKMVVGHGRYAIYFSNLIVTSIGGVIYLAASWAVVLIAGFSVGGKLGMEPELLAAGIFIGLLAMISACSLVTVIGMLSSSKSSAAVVAVTAFFSMILGLAFLVDLLNRPEYQTVHSLTRDENGEITNFKEQVVKNSMYIESPEREVLQAVCDILPGGQAVQLNFGSCDLKVMPPYSMGFTAAVSVIGIAVFRRKDLK